MSQKALTESERLKGRLSGNKKPWSKEKAIEGERWTGKQDLGPDTWKADIVILVYYTT